MTMRSTLPALLVCLLAVACTSDGPAPTDAPPAPLASGIDRSGFDDTTRPQDDFHRYVNGGWIDRTAIPADKSSWGSFNILREESDEQVRAILEELSRRTDLVSGSDDERLAHLYASLMHGDQINAAGIAPVEPSLATIDSIATLDQLFRVFGELRVVGVDSPLAQFVNVDSADASRYAVYISQAGLGLPNRNYYLREGAQFDTIRARYPEYIATLLTFAGLDGADARARAVYDLERRIANSHWPPEENRDATKTNNRYAVADLDALSARIPWTAFLDGAGLSDRTDLFVRQPSYVEALADLLDADPLDVWKDYLRFHVINDAAPWLADDVATARFEFYGRLINGQQEMEPRWQRAVHAVNGAMGEAVGRIYVERHFPPDAKVRMDALVRNILRAFESSIADLDWMSDETKAKAQEKRRTFTTKIGYPDTWRDYGTLDIRADGASRNMMRAAAWEYDRRLRRIDDPVDRGEWGMTPQTVNAYHNPRMNEIVFPAAILQPPFFDFEADDAVNYGAIGAVIGHEIGHAFDDQGRKTDADGNLNDWWTESDAEAFVARAQALRAQYDGFEVLPGLNVNGQLTLGENIGDLTGLYIGYLAYHMALDGAEPPVIDGFTGDQRLMLGFAQIWRDTSRDEALRRQVLTDPHSPSRFRANGPLRNFDPFYDAFDVAEGDGMYLPPEQRVKIW
jgi:predicted metalloendopeptidase